VRTIGSHPRIPIHRVVPSREILAVEQQLESVATFFRGKPIWIAATGPPAMQRDNTKPTGSQSLTLSSLFPPKTSNTIAVTHRGRKAARNQSCSALLLH